MRGFERGILITSVSCATLAYGYSHPATAWLLFAAIPLGAMTAGSRGISFAAGAPAPTQAAIRAEAV